MAVNINTVYQTVLALANKEQRGDDFIAGVMDLYNYFMDFLVSSGIFDYYKEFQAMMIQYQT